MTPQRDDGCCGSYASPPCYMHEADAAYTGLVDPQQRMDVMRWRSAERERLMTERLAMPCELRRQRGHRIADHLEQAVGDVAGLVVGVYWPFHGDPVLALLLKRLAAHGARTALAVIVAQDQPLVFRAATIDETMEDGARGIPGAEIIVPDVVIAAVVGFDARRHRLGTGNGFLDRTLAALPKRPRSFGIGYRRAAIATIYPQPHDIPMDEVVTEDGSLPGEMI